MRKALLLLSVAVALCLGPVGGAAVSRSAKLPTWNPGRPGGFAFADGSAWIAGGDKLLRVDPKTNRVVATIAVSGGDWPVFGGGSIWLSETGRITEIDPATNSITKHIVVDTLEADPLVYSFGSLWLVNREGQLLRVNPATGTTLATIKVQGPADWSPILATGAGSVWVASGDRHAVIRVDPATNSISGAVTGISHTSSLLTVGVGQNAVWAHANAAADGRGILYRIDPAKAKIVAKIVTSQVAGGQYGGTNIAFGAGSIWTINGNSRVSRIHAKPLRVVKSKTTPMPDPVFIGFGYHSVWVQDFNSGQTVRIPVRRFRR
jgi:streptogramin lyase